jgi:bis(5'-nucleosyl)-tetraphosphatase (symmetrical)
VQATDGQELGHWLRTQPLLHYDKSLNVVMTHAGIAPIWDLQQAISLAKELENILGGDNFRDFLNNMYGNQPDCWSDSLDGVERLRVICNYLTRMRFCDEHGRLILHYKGAVSDAPPELYPWYAAPNRKKITADIIFGHWAALMGKSSYPKIHAIDTGCIWGGELIALRLLDMQRFTVPGMVS